MTQFTLDDRLKADCIPVCEFELCNVLLLNDSRWPWLVFVPRIINAVEMHDLGADEQMMLQRETIAGARALAGVTGCEKINTGALGNIVRQLHIHVIARNTGDANWPGPVWGYETRVPYGDSESNILIKKLLRGFG